MKCPAVGSTLVWGRFHYWVGGFRDLGFTVLIQSLSLPSSAAIEEPQITGVLERGIRPSLQCDISIEAAYQHLVQGLGSTLGAPPPPPPPPQRAEQQNPKILHPKP